MIDRLISFLNESPVNFLAVRALSNRLEAAGVRRWDAGDALRDAQPGSAFYCTKNDSALFAFQIGIDPLPEAGFRVICAHADSPTFRVKPNPETRGDGNIAKLSVEVYGGAILSTWLDRPLSLAGRVIVRGRDVMHPETRLVHIRRPLLTIPSLCIHFNRQVNDGVKLSVQKEMSPILGIVRDELDHDGLLLRILREETGVSAKDILDYDLYLYDTTPACRFGANDEFLSSGRLDDLSMVHAGLEAFTASLGDIPRTTRILAIFDNEETGSHTKQGAASPFLANVIRRIVAAQGGVAGDFERCAEHAFMVSADNAHAWHPNYGDKYDPHCHPVLGGGPVIKFNAAQKYVSDAVSAAVFAGICEAAGVPCQRFVNHGDIAGGSTLGNILTATMPLAGVDMGNPILAMHSVRETGSTADHEYCIRAFREFYR